MDKLKGKKIVYPLSRLRVRQGADPRARRARAAKYGFDVLKIPSRRPGKTQESQWLQIRQAKPDYVILWTCGVMNTVALEDGRQGRLPARQAARRVVGGLGRGRDSRG